MDSPEVIFNKVVGCIISLSITKDYCGYMSAIYDERKDNYIRNKFAEVEKANDKLMKAMNIEVDAAIPEIKEMIEFNMELIFQTVALDPEKQKRVLSLVQKLHKESNR